MNQSLVLASNRESLVRLVLDSVSSEHSRRAYRRGVERFISWYEQTQPGPLSKATIQRFRADLESAGLASSSIRQHLVVVRRLLREASDNGLVNPEVVTACAQVKNPRGGGVRAGRWLTATQAEKLIKAPDESTLKGKRDRALLSLLIGCGLRREELVQLELKEFEEREGRWVIPHLMGKGKRVRLVTVPAWVKLHVDEWTTSAGIREKRIFRSLRKGSSALGQSLSVKAVWKIVQVYAGQAGIGELTPHDLRRTCAKLCRAQGGDLEQIQLLLGHSSLQVTEVYLGSRQDIQHAVNDSILKFRK